MKKKNNKKHSNQKELLESILKNPIVNERGELVVDDLSIFGDYASRKEVEAELDKFIK